jgi:hypothetical protein
LGVVFAFRLLLLVLAVEAVGVVLELVELLEDPQPAASISVQQAVRALIPRFI